ncbi:MAG: hypothetical protein JSS05_12390 [Proteobacteria bacterium]|nr:hypothetical protein [Pseudomonadota bacterium]
MTNDAPLTVVGTGISVASLDFTVNGPVPPVMPTVFGVLPKATNVAGDAVSDELGGVGVDDFDPPHPESSNAPRAANKTRCREAAGRSETIVREVQ